MNPVDCPCFTLFITLLAPGYPLNHGFAVWCALLDTSDLSTVFLLLLVFYMIVACSALGSLKVESKEQTVLKEDFFAHLSRATLSFLSFHFLAVLKHSEYNSGFYQKAQT